MRCEKCDKRSISEIETDPSPTQYSNGGSFSMYSFRFFSSFICGGMQWPSHEPFWNSFPKQLYQEQFLLPPCYICLLRDHGAGSKVPQSPHTAGGDPSEVDAAYHCHLHPYESSVYLFDIRFFYQISEMRFPRVKQQMKGTKWKNMLSGPILVGGGWEERDHRTFGVGNNELDESVVFSGGGIDGAMEVKQFNPCQSIW